ncbi:MAG: hypothetical protein ACR2GU_05895 [Rubrobacteraceae bacterium]
MGDLVKGLVLKYIEEFEGKVSGKSSKPVPFSMRLGKRDHDRLLWLAGRLDVPKTRLAEEMLGAAVEEAIEQYAKWAAPEDPEGFLKEALAEAETFQQEKRGPHNRQGPQGLGGPGPRGRDKRQDKLQGKPPKPGR